MAIVTVPTSFNIDLEFDVPGLGRRTASLLLDMFAQYLYMVLASYLMSKLSWLDDHWALGLILMSPVFLYHIIMEISTNGQSIGKKVMNLRVVSLSGGRPSISQLLIRWLLRVSDLWMVILLYLLINVVAGGGGTEAIIAFVFGMGFLITDIVLVSNGKKPQRIGDLLAQTILIKTSVKESLDNTIFQEVEDGYTPLFPEVMRISDKDLNIIKNLLNTKKHEDISVAAEKVKEFLQIKTDMYPDQFLERLLTDYNYLSVK